MKKQFIALAIGFAISGTLLSTGWTESKPKAAAPSADQKIFKQLADSKAQWKTVTEAKKNFFLDTAGIPKGGQSGTAYVRIKETNIPSPKEPGKSMYYVARMAVNCADSKISSPSHILFFNPAGKVVNPMGPLKLNWAPANSNPAGKPMLNMVCKKS